MFTKSTGAIMAILIVIGASVIARAQEAREESPSDELLFALQVIVLPQADGMVEFGVRQGESAHYPLSRFLNMNTATRGRWLASSIVPLDGPPPQPLALSAGTDEEAAEQYRGPGWEVRDFGIVPLNLRVAVRVHSDGYVEFGILHDGDRLLPDVRWLSPATREANINQALVSSEVTIDVGQSPADLVRELSLELANDVRPDVAQICVLESATEKADRRTAVEDWYEAHRDARVIGETADYGQRLDSSQEAAWVYSSGRVTRGQPADRYVFIVRDVRYQQPTIFWSADFNCADQGSTDSGNGRLEIQPEGGS